MRVLFCRSRAIGSVLIRALTFSRWSHVAVCINDTEAIEATWRYVRRVPIAQIVAHHSTSEYRELPLAKDAVPFLLAQVGKHYDLSALFAVLMPYRNWATDDKWFCSELVAAATELFTEANRVSPQMLYLLSKPIGTP